MIGPGDMITRLAVATLLGAVVGLERERLERAAGLRTHALVAVAACLVMLVSAFGFNDAVQANRTVVLDPSRVAAQVVSGIGFLGAGTIILRKNAVRGLTTAASIWAVAALGLAVGGGLYVPALSATALMLVVLIGMRPLEGILFPHKRAYSITLQVRGGVGRLAAVESAILGAGLDVQMLRLRPGGSGGDDKIELEVGPSADADLSTALERLRRTGGVRSITYRRRAMHGVRAEDVQSYDDLDLDETEVAAEHA